MQQVRLLLLQHTCFSTNPTCKLMHNFIPEIGLNSYQLLQVLKLIRAAKLTLCSLGCVTKACWQERPEITAGSDSRSHNNAQEHQAKSVHGELLPGAHLLLEIACATVSTSLWSIQTSF